MSLFTEQEVLASVYQSTDSDVTKISKYTTPTFTIKINPIRRNEDAISILGQDIGEYVCNVNGRYPYADSIRKSDKIVVGSDKYIVENAPRYNRLFNRYKLILRRVIQ